MNSFLSNDFHGFTGGNTGFVTTFIQLALYLLLIVGLSSCATKQLQKDYEMTTTLDTVSAYELFIRKYPDSEYTPKAAKRLQALRESQKLKDIQRETMAVERELKMTEKVNELTAENVKRIKKLHNYAVGTVTLPEFLGDGWNLEDPYGGKLGIVGIFHHKDVSPQESVDIIMGFTYKPDVLEGQPPVDPFLLKRHREALETELSHLKQGNINKRLDILPLRTTKADKKGTQTEGDSPEDLQTSEPFFESTVLVKFDAGLLKDIDLSSLKYINVKQLADLDLSVYRCVITHDWLEQTAGMSKRDPPPSADDILQVFSARGLDKIQIAYKPKDEANLQGTGTVRGEKHPYRITKENVTYLPVDESESALINAAVLDRASGRLRLNFALPQGKKLTVEYHCEQCD
ncbi:MAG: hypothetical protein JXA41_03850 [Deltaproteobacteria bacterium]|nr:hypothetical protein [Deltaproteobacteria bacterium]